MSDLDFDKLQRIREVLLAPYREVSLEPTELINDGYAVLLAPARGSEIFSSAYLKTESLPILDLRKAGIDADRRKETILRLVREKLTSRTFMVRPEFDFEVGLSLMIWSGLAILSTLEATLDIICLGFWIEEKSSPGFPMEGLNLSKPIIADAAHVCEFLCPTLKIKGSHERALMHYLTSYVGAGEVLKSKQEAVEKARGQKFRNILTRGRFLQGREEELKKQERIVASSIDLVNTLCLQILQSAA